MIRVYVFGLIGIAILLCSFSTSADNYIECNNCTDNQRESSARGWAVSNGSVGEVNEVHIIDLVFFEVSSYEVSLYVNPSAITTPLLPMFLPSSVEIPSPYNIEEDIVKFAINVKKLNAAAEELVIPSSLVPSAWEFTNCAYCSNNVQDFINSSLTGEVLTIANTIAYIAQTYGLISTGVPNTFIVKLEAGGYLEVVMNLTTNATLSIVVSKVVDEDNNTVPFSAEDLDSLRLYISSIDNATSVNAYIGAFDYYININTGSVTIMECDGIPEGQTAEEAGDPPC